MTARNVIRSYLAITGLYTLSASLIWGVNTLFLLDAGLNILGVFIANGVFTGSMALFEIPTGVLADTRGRRLSFLLSLVVVSVGTLGYVGVGAAGGGLGLFVAMSVVLGLGYTFYSGAVEAWLVDALKATGYEGELDQIFARGAIVTGTAMIFGTVSGGWLGSLDLTIPFLARAGLWHRLFHDARPWLHAACADAESPACRDENDRAGEHPFRMAQTRRPALDRRCRRPGDLHGVGLPRLATLLPEFAGPR